jgi:hypothetical protein
MTSTVWEELSLANQARVKQSGCQCLLVRYEIDEVAGKQAA